MQAFIPNTPWSPILFLALFLASSVLMIWSLGMMEKRGLEGTALGTLVMPYCSGLSNIIFAIQMGRKGGDQGYLVLENCIVNNITNLTLLIGLPTLIWGMMLLAPKKKSKGKAAKLAADNERLNRLSLLLTLCAGLFFTGAVWTLAGDGTLSKRDGWMLVGIFLFWQVFQIFDVLKYNVHQKRKQSWLILIDGALVLFGGYLMFESIDWLLTWFTEFGSGFIGEGGLGWFSGWLMVVPNALLAFYYSHKGRSDIAYSSQIGDGHICIPLCLGCYALFVEESHIPMANFDFNFALMAGAMIVQIVFVLLLGRLPKWLGLLLFASYGGFLYSGLMGV
jgi:cation:H+ antiporter